MQDSEAIAKDEVQKVLLLTEERRKQWGTAWEDQKAKLEQNLQVCQFYYDLRQVYVPPAVFSVHPRWQTVVKLNVLVWLNNKGNKIFVSCFCQVDSELDELHRQLHARSGNFGSSLSSANMTSQAFKNFENTVQVIEKKINKFVSTADAMIRDQHYDSRRIRHEVDEVQRKWNAFYQTIAHYRDGLDNSTKFFELMDQVERTYCESLEWIMKSTQLCVPFCLFQV